MHRYFNEGGCPPAMRRYNLPFYEKFHYGRGYRRPKYNVPVNIVENETHYEVHVYALSFDKEQIKVSVVNDVLYINGSRTVDENNLPNFIQQEYPIKSFERIIHLHGQVDTTRISARQEEGVLKLTLPKTPEAQKSSQEIVIQ
jgi:HSP20 family protein